MRLTALFSGRKHLVLVALCFAGVRLAAFPVVNHAEVLGRLGKGAILQGEYALAAELMEKAAELAPRESDYAHWLGNSYAWAASTAPMCDKPALGRKCLAAYLRAIELNPDNLPARFSLLNFYRRVPRIFGGGATRAADEAAAIANRDPVQGAYARAILLGDEKKYTAAFVLLADIIRRNPSHYGAHLLLGRLALESGARKQEGEAALRRCLELTPSENDESHAVATRCLEQLAAVRETVVARR